MLLIHDCNHLNLVFKVLAEVVSAITVMKKAVMQHIQRMDEL